MIIPNNNPNLYVIAVRNAELWRRENVSSREIQCAIDLMEGSIVELREGGLEADDLVQWTIVGWNISSDERKPICAGATADEVENSYYWIFDAKANTLNGELCGDPRAYFISTLAPAALGFRIRACKERLADMKAA